MQPKLCSVSNIQAPAINADDTGIPTRHVISKVAKADPFIMVDHIGPVEFSPKEAIGAPDHPHAGLQVLSYLVNGEVSHEDTTGQHGTLRSGSVQLLSCGKGLVHYEMPSNSMYEEGGIMEGFQLWINMPQESKLSEPTSEEISPCDVPIVRTEDNSSEIKVVSGEIFGMPGAVECITPVLLLDIKLNPRKDAVNIELDSTYDTRCLYYYSCSDRNSPAILKIYSSNDKFSSLKLNETCELDQGEVLQMKNDSACECRCILIAGKSLGEPLISYASFALSSRDDINQMIDAFNNGDLGVISGREDRERQNEEAMALCRSKFTGDEAGDRS